MLRTIIFFVLILILPLSNIIYAQEQYKPKIGLVLSGGGAKGLAHVGVLKVLEELGIRPDYIGGTSMGSLVGGLYAIGYTVDSLEKIAKNNDWLYLFTDEISRRDLALEEKKDADRFFFSIPVDKNMISMPSGVINGQNIENMLTTYCSPVYNIRDFNKFPIPFLCVSTDIETGEAVVFRDGYLPNVLRSSISIPSVFNPVEIDGRLLVDGGIVNNFPVDQVKKMGADIIIGVDVGFNYYKKDQLNSIIKILEQSVFFYGEKLNAQNKSLCDILIEPEIEDYNSSSFGSADTLVALGEQAARKMLPELKKIAALINASPETLEKRKDPAVDSMQLMEIRVNGLKNVSGKLISGKLQLEVFDKVMPNDIERAIERLYSSLYFEKISYEIEKKSTGIRLIINITEANKGEFRLGLHYDSNYRSSIILNTTMRNILFDGSKLSSSVSLGENPFFEASFFKNNGWKPGFGLNLNASKLDAFQYRNSHKISSIAYNETSIQLFTQSTFWNSYALGAGLEYEFVHLVPQIDPLLDLKESKESFFNYYGFIKMDSYDNAYYPKRGLKIDGKLKFINTQERDAILFLTGRFSQSYRISDKLNYINHFYFGAVNGDTIPYQYNFYTGGVNPTQRNGMLPFIGLENMEEVSKNALIWSGDFQYEVFPDIYLIAKANIGNLQNDFKDLLNTEKLLGGYGLTLGYDSFIGPIELSLQKSYNKKGLLGFVNIGFWF